MDLLDMRQSTRDRKQEPGNTAMVMVMHHDGYEQQAVTVAVIKRSLPTTHKTTATHTC
jgi:hypothetical protein